MTFRLSDPCSSPRRLSQSVVQASEMLGLMRAEMGRVFGFKCEQFSALFEGRSMLEEGTHAYQQGVLFVRFYQALYDRMEGDSVQMVHWLRRHNRELANSPFYLIIDEGRLAEVVQLLEKGEE
jgi:hypothetical protein